MRHSGAQMQKCQRAKGSASEKSEERKAPRKRTPMGRQEQESARCKSPPLTTSPTFLASVQEPFGQVPRGLGECTWPESLDWYHANCAPNPTVLPGSLSHCLLASAPGLSPIPPVFPQVCSLQGIARHVLGTWAGVKDLLLRFARRFLTFHSSRAKGSAPRDLLPIPFHLVSEVMEPVNFNKEDPRFRTTRASSDLNDWLLVVVACLNWLHGAGLGAPDPPVYHGPLSKVQGKYLVLLA